MGEFHTDSNEITDELIVKYESQNIEIEKFRLQDISIIPWGLVNNRRAELKKVIDF